MNHIGPIELLIVGFDGCLALPPAVGRWLDQLRGRGVIRILDVLYVSKDEKGVIRLECRREEDLDRPSTLVESTLWQLLDGGDSEFLPVVPLDLHRACEVGLDFAAVEGLAYVIEPDTSALLILLEPSWASDLLDAVVASGGFSVVFGCLEPETMLLLGPGLALAASAARESERDTVARGAAMLDALATLPPARANIADVIPVLIESRLLHERDVDDALRVLSSAGLVSVSSLERAREQADAAVAETESHRHPPR